MKVVVTFASLNLQSAYNIFYLYILRGADYDKSTT